MKEQKQLNKIYFDDITDIKQMNVEDDKSFFKCLENADRDNKYEYLYIDYIPQEILKNYNLTRKEDIRNFYKILYKYDTPILPMIKYDKKSKIIELHEPGIKVDAMIYHCKNMLVYVDMKNKDQDNEDIEGNHCFTAMNYHDIVSILLKNSTKFYQYDERKPLSISDISQDDFYQLVYPTEQKVLSKVRKK